MTALKLLALDREDLSIISVHMQDAVLRNGDMVYSPKYLRFAAMFDRFDWLSAENPSRRTPYYLRRKAALRFERVLGAKLHKMGADDDKAAYELLAIQFHETVPPGGQVKLVFSGGAAIRLDVECIEAEMCDTGSAWRTRHRPHHAGAEDADTPVSPFSRR